MKRAINNKLYNTDTAKKIAGWDNGCINSDLNYCSEELFQKKTGEYFLFGQGGPMSRYSRSVGNNNWSGGEAIIPLTTGAASEWAQRNLSAERYEAIFGKVSEDGEEVNMTFRFSPDVAVAITRAAADQKTSRKAVIEALVREYCAR